MIVSAIFGALIALIKYVADPYDKLPAITYWLMGSFSTASYENVSLVSIPIIFGCAVLYFLRWKINILSMGDEEATALGVNPFKLRLIIIAMATLITAACVTITGIIGWVGLVIPHILSHVNRCRSSETTSYLHHCRSYFHDYRGFNSHAQLFAAEIPIGIITALVGAPFFACLFYRTRGDWK